MICRGRKSGLQRACSSSSWCALRSAPLRSASRSPCAQQPGSRRCGRRLPRRRWWQQCVVRDSKSGHHLLLPPAKWCPVFATRATQEAAEAGKWGRRLKVGGAVSAPQSTQHI